MLCPIAPVQASKPLWPVVWGSEVTGLSALTHIGSERSELLNELRARDVARSAVRLPPDTVLEF